MNGGKRMAATYNDIPTYIRQRMDFQGNSMSGNKRKPGWPTSRGRGSLTVPDNADYVIWSYQTPIGYAIEETLFVTTEKFSSTTSRHQSLLRGLGARQINPINPIVSSDIEWADEIYEMEHR